MLTPSNNRFFIILIAASSIASLTVCHSGHDDSTIELIANTRPSVVVIEAKSPLSSKLGPLGDVLSNPKEADESKGKTKWYTSVGSGVIWDKRGHLVTTASLVHDAQVFTVRLITGDVMSAELIGKDEETNLAVLKITSESTEFPSIPIREKFLPEGAWVALLGYGIGGVPSIATGVAGIPPELFDPTRSWFQFTAPVRPGNSGSALIDSNGQLAGIVLGREEDSGFQAIIRLLTQSNTSSGSPTTNKAASISNFGIAIPISMASVVIREIIRSGNYSRGWIGVIVEIDQTEEKHTCLKICQIVQDSPADDAGLQTGDRLLQLNGQNLTLPSDLGRLVTQSNIGHSLPLVFERDGVRSTIQLEIRRKPEIIPQLLSENSASTSTISVKDLGLTVNNMTPALRQHLKAPQNNGILVAEVSDTEIIKTGDIAVGDIITHLSGHAIKTVEDFNQQLASMDLKSATQLTAMRNGKQIQVSLPLYKFLSRSPAQTSFINTNN